MNIKKIHVWALIISANYIVVDVSQASWYKEFIDSEIAIGKNKSEILFNAMVCYSEHECLPVVIDLLAAGANPNFRNWYDSTCLYFATRNGFLAMTKVLLLAGANPNIESGRKTVLYFVLKDSQVFLEKMTKDVSPDFYKRLNIIKILLTAGADPNIKDENGKKAGDILVRLGIDHTLYKPNLTYATKQEAYQKYLNGDPSMLCSMLGLPRQATLGTTSEKEGACDHIAAQNRDFFKDVVDPSLAEEIRLYSDQDKACLRIEQSEVTLRAELTKKRGCQHS